MAVAIADRDPEEAAAVAESIADPAGRAAALIGLIDALPAAQRERKLALLDRAALHARATSSTDERLRWMGQVAERWYELGEVELLGLPHEARWRKIWSDWETILGGPKHGF